MTKYVYSNEKLKEAVEQSESVYGVMRFLGIRLTGGSNSHIKRRIVKAGFDTGHFKGQASNKGRKFLSQRRTPESVLVLREGDEGRQHAHLLRRSLIEIGVKYECVDCDNIGEWRDKKITLHVDHISEDWLDDRRENLRFLCPNCHSVRGEQNRQRRKSLK